jgi:hypothetical protein
MTNQGDIHVRLQDAEILLGSDIRDLTVIWQWAGFCIVMPDIQRIQCGVPPALKDTSSLVHGYFQKLG